MYGEIKAWRHSGRPARLVEGDRCLSKARRLRMARGREAVGHANIPGALNFELLRVEGVQTHSHLPAGCYCRSLTAANDRRLPSIYWISLQSCLRPPAGTRLLEPRLPR